MTLPAGESWSTLANATTEVEVPGILTARVTPGMSALEIQTQYAAAQQDLAAALATAQVADLTAARSTDQRRRELQSARDQLTATLAGLCGDDDVEQLRSRLVEFAPCPRFPATSRPTRPPPVPNSTRPKRAVSQRGQTARPTDASRRWR